MASLLVRIVRDTYIASKHAELKINLTGLWLAGRLLVAIYTYIYIILEVVSAIYTFGACMLCSYSISIIMMAQHNNANGNNVM